MRRQGACGRIEENLRLYRCHAWGKQADRPHYSTEKQTDDSTGERQEIHLQTRFSLLAVLYGNHFTLVPYHIYTEVK